MQLIENSVWNFDVNGKPALNALGEIETKISDLKEKQSELTRGTKEWTESKTQLKELEAELKKVREEMGVQGMTVQQLKQYHKELVKELQQLTPETEAYIKKSEEIKDVNDRLKSVKSDVRAVSDEVKETKSTWDNLKDWMTGALAAFSIVNILDQIVQFTRESLKMATEQSDSFAKIAKATEMTKEEVKALNDEIAQIDTRTAQKSLLEIAQVGGQIGIAKDEMLGFVQSVDMAVVALGDEFSGGAEEVSQTMGTLSKLFKETKDMKAGDAINDIGSAINELGAAGSATGPVVADFAMRMGQLGNLSPQISQTLGLGAAFQELGLTSEIAASGLSNILLTAAKGTEVFADHLGKTDEQFKELINTDPNGFLLELAASFKGMPTDVVVKQLDDLGIKSNEAVKVMSLLSDQTETVAEKQALASKAMEEGTSLQKEFNTMNTTAAAIQEKQEKAIAELQMRLGNFLLPVLLNVTTASIAFVKAIAAVPEFIEENKEMFLALGAAILAFNAHLILATANSLLHSAATKGSIIWTEAATAAQLALDAALTANPIGVVVAAIALFVGGLVALYQHSETFRGAVNGLWAAIKTGAEIVVDVIASIWQGFQQLIDKFPLVTRAFDAIVDAHKKAFEGIVQIIEWVGDKIEDLGGFFMGLVSKVQSVGTQIGTALKPGFDFMINGFNTVKDAVNSFISMVGSGIDKVGSFLKSITPSGFTDAVKTFTDAGSRISKSFNDAFSSEQSKGHAAQTAADNAHNSGKVAGSKKTAEQIAADAALAKNKEIADANAKEETARKSREFAEKQAKAAELAEKAKANEAHRKSEEAKAAASAKKDADDKVKAEKDAIKLIEDAEIKAIADKETREIAQLNLSFKREVEKVAASKASETTQAAWIKALSEQLQRDIDKIEADYRKKKIEEEKKRIDEINKLESAQRTERTAMEFATQKNIIDTQLMNERLSISQRQALKLQLIELEKKEELARIEQVAAAERAKVNETSAQLMKLAGDDAAKKKQIETETAATLRSIDANRISQTENANAAHQAALKANEASNLAERRANQNSFFAAIKSAMDGDFSGFMDILNKKLSNEKAANNENLQNFTKTGTEILSVAKQGLETLIAMSQVKLKKELANIQKEKETQIESWEEKYEAGLISKDEYEEGIAAANKTAAEKEHAEKLKAWKREQKMQIGMALINAAMAALKSLAMMGFPLGLIGVVASAALAAVQIGIIKSQQPPSMAKGGIIRNGGIPQGGSHGQKYGDDGIALVNRRTNEEVGEMEGGEPIMILSRNSYRNNSRVIDALIDSSLHRNGAPIHAEKGGVFNLDHRNVLEPLKYGESYLFGSKKKKAQKAADEAAAQAAADAAEMQADLDAEIAAAQASADAAADTSGYDANMNPYGDVEGGDAGATTASTNAEIGKSQAMMNTIGKNTAATVSAVEDQTSVIREAVGVLRELKGSMDSAASAGWAAAGASNRAADAAAMNARNNL